MKKVSLKQVHYEGISMQVPEIWGVETETYLEEDGSRSYTLSVNARGRDVRSIDVSWGVIPEGSDAYLEASRAYEDVMNEEDLDANDEPIISFDFKNHVAYGFNVWTDDDLPCFFFCLDIPSKGKNNLLTVLVCAANNDELQSLVDFVEEYLDVE
ncbi:MAG: hypothetical protein J6R30_05400 [Bacteroidales bacterium]|nr:hypothetical protein [Bacteroidales bacterium]